MNAEINPELAAEILQKIDVLAEIVKYGFKPLRPPDTEDRVLGCFTSKSGEFVCGLLNVGWGPNRGDFTPCRVPGMNVG